MRTKTLNVLSVVATLLVGAGQASAQKIYLNPSDQDSNPVGCGTGRVESEFALINANIAAGILSSAGFDVQVDQDFYNSPSNANSWGADEFVSVHSNAFDGSAHGTETLHYPSSNSIALADNVQNGLLANLSYLNRGIKPRTDLHVLNATNMPAALTEVVFHDCCDSSGGQGHPPSESDFLMSANDQQLIGSGIANGICNHFGSSCTSQPPAKGRLLGVIYENPDINNKISGTVSLDTGESQSYPGSGTWIFELDPGTYTITASAPGYQSNSVTRTVVAGQDTWGSVGLDRDVVPPEEDAGVPPEEDAGTPPEEDAGVPPVEDAGTPPVDDAGTPPVDDAGTPPDDDAGQQVDDAGAPVGDGGLAPDGGTSGHFSDLPDPPDGSCGCSSTSTGLIGLPLLLGLYAARGAWRMRRRR